MRRLPNAERTELRRKLVEYHQQRAEKVARNLSESDGGKGSFFGPEKAGIQKGVLGGIAMMAIAVIWFFVGLGMGYVFFYPPILFLIGLYAFGKGIITGNFNGKVNDSAPSEGLKPNGSRQLNEKTDD